MLPSFFQSRCWLLTYRPNHRQQRWPGHLSTPQLSTTKRCEISGFYSVVQHVFDTSCSCHAAENRVNPEEKCHPISFCQAHLQPPLLLRRGLELASNPDPMTVASSSISRPPMSVVDDWSDDSRHRRAVLQSRHRCVFRSCHSNKFPCAVSNVVDVVVLGVLCHLRHVFAYSIHDHDPGTGSIT